MDAGDKQALEVLFKSMRDTIETMSALVLNINKRLTILEDHRDVQNLALPQARTEAEGE